MKTNKKCPICKKKFKNFLNLGKHPCADTFVKNKLKAKNLKRYQLIVGYCDCEHMSSIIQVSPHKRYKEHKYSYTSNNSPVSLFHFKQVAKKIINKFRINKFSNVIEIGSNDGTFLKNIKDLSSSKVLGIDPSDNMCNIAKKKGVNSLNIFFNNSSSGRLIREYGKFDILYGANVFNHIEDPYDFLSACKKVLKDSGALILEVPDLESLFRKIGFDTIYHEHRQYYSKKSINKLFKLLNLRIISIENINYMSGSIRIFAKNENYKKKKFQSKTGINEFKKFKNKIFHVKREMLNFVKKNKLSNKITVGIGAATKGNTLLNYCNFNSKDIKYILENSPHKIGKYTPGSAIRIVNEKKIKKFDSAIILPWNITKHLTKKFLQNSNLSFTSIPKIVKKIK